MTQPTTTTPPSNLLLIFHARDFDNEIRWKITQDSPVLGIENADGDVVLDIRSKIAIADDAASSTGDPSELGDGALNNGSRGG